MKFLFWIVVFAFVSYVADAQQLNNDAKSSAVPDSKAGQKTAASLPSPREEPEISHHTFYYRPGDIEGVPYDSIVECSRARQQAGNVGICVMK